jgi:hypothetical protein
MTWGEEYVNLVLRMEQHFEGFVDAYCGSKKVKNKVEKEEKKSLDELFSEAEHLLETVPADDRKRKIFLEKQVTGIKTTVQILQGEEIDYVTQVERFFDIIAKKVSESNLETHVQVLHDIFKTESLSEAVEEWRKEKEITGELLRECLDIFGLECRKRSQRLLPLPEGEHIDFVLVDKKPWSGYNWYLGEYCSRVEINTDVPVLVTAVPSLVSHEAYPGHHTEHAIKEHVLYREKGFEEACVFVYNTPECLISEGIATAALEMIFENQKEALQFLNHHTEVNIDVDRDAAISEALNKLSACSGNAALMIHQEGCDVSEAVQYLIEVGLSTKKRAEKQVEFMTHPLFRAYIFNYYVGKVLVRDALTEMDPQALYVNQLCPSNLRYFRNQ